MSEAPRDQNRIPALLFESASTSGLTIPAKGDQTTGRLYVDSNGAGTVTSVSVVTANGVSGSVATSTTTPAITLTLGSITPSAVQISGLTASEIVGTDASKNLVSLAVATYPSLTELSYVKGLTSAIQTQLDAKGIGDALTTNPLSQFAATTSAQLAGVISDETGSGSLVFATSPTLVTPVLGVATATSINKMAITAPATSSTLAVADGKTLTASNTLTLAGTDSTTMTFPNATDTVMGLGATQTVTGAKTFGDALLIATTPKITTGIKDSNGNLIIALTATASAVNYLTVVNATTGNGVDLQATGSDTNIDLKLTAKGTGKIAPQKSVNFGAFTAYFTETDNGNSSTADTIDWTLSNKQKSTLTGNCTFTFTAPPGPCSLILKLVQDATGSRTVTWPATVHWSGGTAPTLTTTANKVDIITFYYDGTTYFGNSTLNFTA